MRENTFDHPNADTPWELYDLAHDGTETKNLAAQHPDLVYNLEAKRQS